MMSMISADSAHIGKLRSGLTLPTAGGFLRSTLARVDRRLFAIWVAALAGFDLYTLIRSYADNLGFTVRGDGLEMKAFPVLPSEWLQSSIYAQAPKPLEWTTVVVHSSWFVIPWLAAAWVTRRRPDRLVSFFTGWLAVMAIALTIFALFPTRPPWMEDGNVTRLIAIRVGGQITDPNPVAAFPSMHVALPMVTALWFWRERWLRPCAIMLAYTALVALEVVFAGEHYVADVVAAAVVSAAAIFLLTAWERRVHVGWRKRLRAQQLAVRERGQNLVEFALLMPFIIALLAVIVILGLALNTRSSLQQAMREGARQAAIGASLAQVQSLAAGNAPDTLSTGDVQVCYPTGPSGTIGKVGDPVRVYIQKGGLEGYPYTLVQTGGIIRAFNVPSLTVRMSPRATSRLEKSVDTPTAC